MGRITVCQQIQSEADCYNISIEVLSLEQAETIKKSIFQKYLLPNSMKEISGIKSLWDDLINYADYPLENDEDEWKLLRDFINREECLVFFEKENGEEIFKINNGMDFDDLLSVSYYSPPWEVYVTNMATEYFICVNVSPRKHCIYGSGTAKEWAGSLYMDKYLSISEETQKEAEIWNIPITKLSSEQAEQVKKGILQKYASQNYKSPNGIQELWKYLFDIVAIHSCWDGWRHLHEFIGGEKCLMFFDKEEDADVLVQNAAIEDEDVFVLDSGKDLEKITEEISASEIYITNFNTEYLIVLNFYKKCMLGCGTAKNWVASLPMEKCLAISEEIQKAAKNLEIPIEILPPEQAEGMKKNIFQKYINVEEIGKIRFLWEYFNDYIKVPVNDDKYGIDSISEFVNIEKCLLFFNDAEDKTVFAIRNGIDLYNILCKAYQKYQFEFYVTNFETEYLVGFNDAHCIYRCGAAKEWLDVYKPAEQHDPFTDEILMEAAIWRIPIKVLPEEQAETALRDIIHKYANQNDKCSTGWYFLWEALLDASSVYDENGWKIISNFVGEKNCLLFYSNDFSRYMDNCTFEPDLQIRREEAAIVINNGKDLEMLLSQMYGFEFYVTNFEMDYLISFNHEDILQGCGTAKEWVESLKCKKDTKNG